MEEVRPGVYVYDMGQNMVGVPQIKLKKQKADEEITLRYAEMLYPDSEDSGENTGYVNAGKSTGSIGSRYVCNEKG